MTHEFIHIVKAFTQAKLKGFKSVLVTVVDLDGSSYRKPGVRMLIHENGDMVGAVSGGCVEKEILRQSLSVFKTDKPKIITYDGRFRLGCEGFLYILIEPFNPQNEFFKVFEACIKNRSIFEITSEYYREEGVFDTIGTYITINSSDYILSQNNAIKTFKGTENLSFSQTMQPRFKLIIFGAEHDASNLCQFAALTGWEVHVVNKPSESKSINDFPGASQFISSEPEHLELSIEDKQTAVMIMTHSFAHDLKCLMALKDSKPVYIGLLGPVNKRENLLSQLLEYSPEIDNAFLDCIYGPAGLNIGSVTPQEISISIISEILTVTRQKTPMSLKEKTGNIHA
ncbi:MAG: XshC-Cox1-family protein [Flavobacteriaceae bacterium]|nr:XshC-Cox1-family protein [Flavobacteriaceae bacterium]